MDNSDGIKGGTCYALIANEMVIPIVEDCKVNVGLAQALDETVREQRSANEINCYFVTLPIDLGTFMHQIETIWLEVHHMMCNVTSGSSQVDLTSTLRTRTSPMVQYNQF